WLGPEAAEGLKCTHTHTHTHTDTDTHTPTQGGGMVSGASYPPLTRGARERAQDLTCTHTHTHTHTDTDTHTHTQGGWMVDVCSSTPVLQGQVRQKARLSQETPSHPPLMVFHAAALTPHT